MSSNKTVIAVDGPSVVVPGAIEAARQTGAKILLVGNEATLDGELNRLSPSGVDLEIVHAPEVAGMDEKPSDILRRKKNASIQVACRLVRDGAAQGVVSAGHSGASVACGMFIMGRIPGVERPALASLLPTEKEPVVLLDVGATVDCKPYNIFQFGLMGDAFARDILNKESPRVGLLSIGEEEGKGNSQVKEAYELFKMAQNLNFSGNIEGRDLFTGEMDVAVCDGFVGNVALKLSEGLGLSLSRDINLDDLFKPCYGAVILELLDASAGEFLGSTTVDYVINVNGENIVLFEDGYFVDKAVKRYRVPSIKNGMNIILAKVPVGKRTSLEACFLTGDFDVIYNGCTSILAAPSSKIPFGDITRFGMPFYGGNITYKTQLDIDAECDIRINAALYRGALIKVLVDGSEAGKIAFAPYELTVEKLKPGKHTVEYILYGNRVNTFGSLHNCGKNSWVGPDHWYSKGDEWSYEYNLKPVGILKSPVIKVIKR